MCLLINKNCHPDYKPHVAKWDTVVYKIINKSTNNSLYREFEYYPNTLYRLRKALVVEYISIRDGFHSYTTSHDAIKNAHTYYRFHISKKVKVVKFTIPRGAKYFLGVCGDIVSTSIRSGDLEPLTFC